MSGNVNAKLIVTIKLFAFTNAEGGTGMSNWNHNERMTSNVKVEVTKGWYDYETGYRFLGESADPTLTDYLSRVASNLDKRVFFSQFDLVDQWKLAELVKICDQVKVGC